MSAGSDTYETLLEEATKGLAEAQRVIKEEPAKWRAANPFLAPTIPVKDGSHFITKEGLAALHQLGCKWHDNDSAVKASISRKAAAQLAVQAFGNLIDAAQTLPGTALVKTEFLRLLQERLDRQTKREFFYFPVRLFEQDDVPSFSIGPVHFYRRHDWLDAVEKVTGKTPAWKQEIVEHWSGAERSSPLGHDADEVVKFVGPCEWIATIAIDGRHSSRSSVCASTAVVVAIDALGLGLNQDNAKALRAPGDRVEVSMSRSLSQYEGAGGFNSSTSVDVPRLGGKPGAQADYLHDLRKLHADAGKALQDFVDLKPTGSCPTLMRRWVEAMYWFGQARREKSDFIALVKIGISLDVLAKGGKNKGILALASAIMSLAPVDAVTSEGQSLASFVKKLYDEGRSKIAHGGSLALLQELPLEIENADAFAANILTGYVACAANYTGNDAYEDFLAAIPSILPILKSSGP
ncbi:HEPN domain-containing protein [Bradyrhizobium sp. SZCCHNRI3042]|uniref:HEPN domain-containing protein n=1 Tax=Bradyrhizobium sp. SZCCHNRI3042 TaxID=3057291 RepID=UPI00291608AC|nr:HEPN domain-containing protein [Bradyrhizobium sp. SZCCHNRI3042]